MRLRKITDNFSLFQIVVLVKLCTTDINRTDTFVMILKFTIKFMLLGMLETGIYQVSLTNKSVFKLLFSVHDVARTCSIWRGTWRYKCILKEVEYFYYDIGTSKCEILNKGMQISVYKSDYIIVSEII